MTNSQLAIHCDKTTDKDPNYRISIRHNHYDNNWCTVALSVDDEEVTWFLHDLPMMREFASKLSMLSDRLFETATTQEIISRAKEQAANVG